MMYSLGPFSKNRIDSILKLSQIIPVEKHLEEVSEELAFLYVCDQINNQSKADRDKSWRNIAREYPDFKDTILELRRTLRDLPIGLTEEGFDFVDDEDSRKLLGDVLLARLGRIKQDENLKRSEIELMLRELGIPKENIGQPLNLPLKLVMSKLISGELLF